jgi:CMP/dCMP kinase
MTGQTLPSPVAIDGPAASGKSSLGRVLAQRLGYAFLDTGLMYRAVALAALRAGLPPTDEACGPFVRALDLRIGSEPDAHVYLGDEDVTSLLHNNEIEHEVSAYARLPAVRAAMRDGQRAFAGRGRTALAGRDIGEIVLPAAPLKFYLDADEGARAARRDAERGALPTAPREELHPVGRRDRLDSPQTHIPADAIVIDTTELTLDEVIQKALEAVECAAS